MSKGSEMASKEKTPTDSGKQPFESWAAAKKTEAWKTRAAKDMRQWPIGAEVTESEFDQAVYDAANGVIR